MLNDKQINQAANKQKIKEFVLEILRILVISVAIIVPVRYYLIQPFYVKGASMEPNFHDHEYLLIDEISYRLRTPERGEIVVFRYPLNTKEYFIKRIIGLPGETVVLRDGQVYIYNNDNPDGFVLDESSYLSDQVKTTPMAESSVTLSQTEYFLMGDNRPRSMDSRQFGSVNKDLIVGRAIIRGYPFDRWQTFFSSPLY